MRLRAAHFVIMALILLNTISLAQADPQCDIPTIMEAAKDFVIKTSSSILEQSIPESSMRLKAYNDPLYQNSICMANMLIQVRSTKGENFYILVHLHFTINGKVLSHDYDDKPAWKKEKEPDDWKYEWCSFIELVYKNELEKQGCN